MRQGIFHPSIVDLIKSDTVDLRDYNHFYGLTLSDRGTFSDKKPTFSLLSPLFQSVDLW